MDPTSQHAARAAGVATLAIVTFCLGLVPALVPATIFFVNSMGWAWAGSTPSWAHTPWVENYGVFAALGAAIELVILRFAVAFWAKGSPTRSDVSPLTVALGTFVGASCAWLLVAVATRGDPGRAVDGGLLGTALLGFAALTWTGAFTGACVRAHTPLFVDLGVVAVVAIGTAFWWPAPFEHWAAANAWQPASAPATTRAPPAALWTQSTQGYSDSLGIDDAGRVFYRRDGNVVVLEPDGVRGPVREYYRARIGAPLGDGGLMVVDETTLRQLDRNLDAQWSTSLPGDLVDAFALLPDGTSVACLWAYADQVARVIAVDADGAERWRRDGERCTHVAPGLDGDVLVVAQGLRVLGADGAPRWQADLPSPAHFAVADPARAVVYATTTSSLYAFAADGTRLWSIALIDSLVQSGRLQQTGAPPRVAPDGDVLVPLGALFRVSAEGQLVFDWHADSEPRAVLGLADGTALVGTAYGDLYAVARDGTTLWKTAVGDQRTPVGALGRSADRTIRAVSADAVMALPGP